LDLEIRYSTHGGVDSFKKLTPPVDANNPCQPELVRKRRAYLATSAAAPDDIFIIFHSECMGGGCSKSFSLYKYNLNNQQWTFLANISFNGGLSTSFPAFEMNQTNPNIFYLGGVEFSKYELPATTTYNCISRSYQIGDSGLSGNLPVHHDTRAIQMFHSTSNGIGDKILIGTDGGIGYSDGSNSSNDNGWTNLNGHDVISQSAGLVDSELCITEFFDMDVSQERNRYIIGGTQDNGTYSQSDSQNPYTWGYIRGGDGGASLIDWSNPQNRFHRANASLYGGFGSAVIKRCSIDLACNACEQEPIQNFELRQHPFDPNLLYTGKRRLLTFFDTNMGSSPVNTYEFTNCHNIRAFELSPSNPDIMYIGFDGPSSNPKLYRSDNGGTSWTNIDNQIKKVSDNTSGSSTFFGIKDFVIDPLNPNHLWCSLSSYGGNTNNPNCNSGTARVVELIRQPDGTYIETDISSGLPPLPVNTLVREDMSGVMYAGTDIGVYRYEPGGTWECFNMGLPAAIVTDLEIDHCAGRLYAATFGRGIFSSDLSSYLSPVITVSTNQVWEAGPAMYAHNDIFVTNGAKLYIKTKLYMSPGTRIVVEPGAELRVIDGTITAACDNTWGGIYVVGDNTKSQSIPYQQGRVYLNNATIEHAEDAITTRDVQLPSDVGSWYSRGTMGGIIHAYNSKFKNNKRTIEFLQYANKNNAGIEQNNSSFFTLCDFEINDDYRFTSDPLKPFITMWAVNGVRFRGSTFTDNQSGISINSPSEKIGIKSLYAGYNINERCSGIQQYPTPFSCAGGIATTFTNLGYGIQASGINSSSFGIAVRNADFDCWHGIRTLGISSSLAIEGNDFNVKEQIIPDNAPAWSIVPSYGIHLTTSEGYSVQNNKLVSESQYGNPASGDETAGIVVRNNHGNSEQIYRNEFTNFNVSCEAISQNWSGGNPSDANGLEFRCNDFTDGRIDMYVSPEVNPNLTNPTINGIKPIQDLPANRFSTSNPALALHIYNDPGAAQMTYNHHDPASEARVEPTLFTQANMTVVNTGNALNLSSTCPDNLSTDIDIDGGIKTLDGIKNIKNNLILTTLNTIKNRVDGGNTELLAKAVKAATQKDAFEVYQNIIKQAPFTSDMVLKEVSKKEVGFSKGMIRDILVTHPQAAKSRQIQDILDNRSQKLFPFMRKQINAGKAVIGKKEQMELDMAKYRRERNLAINQAIQLLASDSISRTKDMLNFLSGTGDINFEYRLAEAYEEMGEFALADKVLKGIGNMTLNEKEATDHEDYLSLRQLIQKWKQDGKNLAALPHSDLTVLESYTKNPNITAGKAITLLMLNGIDSYQEPVYFPDIGEIEPREDEQGIKDVINEDKLLIYPNPAKSYLIVEYATVMSVDRLLLTITDLNGRQVHQQMLSHQQDEVILSTDKFLAGQYFCIISNRGNTTKTEKFILIK